MRTHMAKVNGGDVLNDSFVENLKTHVEEWVRKNFG